MTSEHGYIATLTGLKPATTYYFYVGSLWYYGDHKADWFYTEHQSFVTASE